MKKFDFKKWIVENKYGKSPNYSNYAGSHGILNEQSPDDYVDPTSITASYIGCGLCPEGAVMDQAMSEIEMGTEIGGYYNCDPITTFDIPDSQVTIMGSNYTEYNSVLTSNEYTGDDPDVLAYFAGQHVYVQLDGDISYNDNWALINVESSLAASVACSGSGAISGGDDNVDDFGEGQWDPSLEGCGNFNNLPSDMQTLACQAYANLGDTNNPSLAMWVQNGGCCGGIDTGSIDSGGQPGPQGTTNLPTMGSKPMKPSSKPIKPTRGLKRKGLRKK